MTDSRVLLGSLLCAASIFGRSEGKTVWDLGKGRESGKGNEERQGSGAESETCAARASGGSEGEEPLKRRTDTKAQFAVRCNEEKDSVNIKLGVIHLYISHMTLWFYFKKLGCQF